ncbi:hypothetical protein Ct9H90mP29_14390 [bacterium]|nr:MAG: hypothetical protein Ct9H90mP29_14390 [bacterium]
MATVIVIFDDQKILGWILLYRGSINYRNRLLLGVLDMVLDPIAVDEKRWSWDFPGVYYGIPLLNFFGWFLTVAMILSIFFLIHIPVNDIRDLIPF